MGRADLVVCQRPLVSLMNRQWSSSRVCFVTKTQPNDHEAVLVRMAFWLPPSPPGLAGLGSE